MFFLIPFTFDVPNYDNLLVSVYEKVIVVLYTTKCTRPYLNAYIHKLYDMGVSFIIFLELLPVFNRNV